MEITKKPSLDWFTKGIQDALIASAREGLRVKWVAIRHGVAPHGLRNILEQGAKRDSGPPFRQFFIRWMEARSALMEELHRKWVTEGNLVAHATLKELFPQVYGKDAEADWDPFTAATASSEDMAQLEAILADPDEFGLLDLFAKHGRLRPDGT